MREGSAFDALRSPSRIDDQPLKFSPHPSYEDYLKIHKVLVGPKTALKLETIHHQLSDESMPQYLSVAGWAATEAALAQPNRSAAYRNHLLEAADDCWQRALEAQLSLNAGEAEHLHEINAAYYYALDLAHLPLLKALVSGDVTPTVRRQVTMDVLNIAEANAVQLQLAISDGDQSAISQHLGVGHECNALLAFHSLDSASLLAIPSSARADSGYHHRHQTHDLLIIQQRWGNIIDMTPAEVKASASNRDRERYKAMLVRGKMHLSIEGKYSPEHTLRAFSGLFAGQQTATEQMITDQVRQTVLDIYWLYKKGERLDEVASGRTSCHYRDSSLLRQAYPELAPSGSSGKLAG